MPTLSPDQARAQALASLRFGHRALFMRMATENMRWHAHRVPGTWQVAIFREDAVFDVPLPRVIDNVQAMTEDTLIARAHLVLQGSPAGAVVATLRRTRIEVGAPRNWRPGYRWTTGYFVRIGDGQELHPPVQRREAYQIARDAGATKITVTD